MLIFNSHCYILGACLDFGDWNRYIEKVFNQRLSEFSATQLFWEIIESYLRVILKHLQPSQQRDAIIISLVNCLLTKYQWILNTMMPSNASGNTNFNEYHQRILQLVNSEQNFSNYLEKFVLDTPESGPESSASASYLLKF